VPQGNNPQSLNIYRLLIKTSTPGCLVSRLLKNFISGSRIIVNTLRTGDADLRFYITAVQDRWRKSAFLTRAGFPCTVHLIMQYIEPVSEWSC